jgi:hypothetical protein
MTLYGLHVGFPLYVLDAGLTVYLLVKLFDVLDVASGVAAISNCSAMLVKSCCLVCK